MRRISWSIVIVSLLAVSLGCSGEATAEESPVERPEVAAPAQPAEEVNAVEGDLSELVGVPAEELGEQLEDLETTVREAVEEASAAETGSTYCESAYEGLAAMVARVAVQYPEDTRPMPPQPTFIHVCERLSPAAQQCLLPTYATAHREECGVVQSAMPEEDQRRLAEMLRGE